MLSEFLDPPENPLVTPGPVVPEFAASELCDIAAEIVAGRADGAETSHHQCLIFDTDTASAAAAAAFIRDGLAAGEKVAYFTDTARDRTVEDLAARGVDPAGHLASGRLDIRPAAVAHLDSGPFDPDRTLCVRDQEITEAARQGYEGFRVVEAMGWAARNGVPPGRLLDYETRVTELLARRQASALCLYDRRTLNADQTAAAEGVHPLVLADAVIYDDGMLRITWSPLPPGLRLAGEADLSNQQALQVALAAAATYGPGDLNLDVAGLRFLDVTGARLLLEAATDPGRNQRVILDSPRPIVKRVLTLGWGDPDNLVMYETRETPVEG